MEGTAELLLSYLLYRFIEFCATDTKAKTKLSDPELIYQFKAIEGMEEDDKNVDKKLIDAFFTKKRIQKLVQ